MRARVTSLLAPAYVSSLYQGSRRRRRSANRAAQWLSSRPFQAGRDHQLGVGIDGAKRPLRGRADLGADEVVE